jgi:hypothetical protein
VSTKAERKAAALRMKRHRERRKVGQIVVTWAVPESVQEVLVRTGQLHGWADDPAEIVKALERHFKSLDEQEERHPADHVYHPRAFIP